MIYSTVFPRITSPIHRPVNSQNSSMMLPKNPLTRISTHKWFPHTSISTFDKGTNPPNRSMKNNTPRKLTLATFFVFTSLFFFSTFFLLVDAGTIACGFNFGIETNVTILVASTYKVVYMTSMEEDGNTSWGWLHLRSYTSTSKLCIFCCFIGYICIQMLNW